MNEKEQKKKAKEFAEFWKGKGYEKGQTAQFWTHLISSVYGICYCQYKNIRDA